MILNERFSNDVKGKVKVQSGPVSRSISQKSFGDQRVGRQVGGEKSIGRLVRRTNVWSFGQSAVYGDRMFNRSVFDWMASGSIDQRSDSDYSF